MSSASGETISPNQYHLQGGGISISFYPDGSGPVLDGRGRLRFTYQDGHHSLAFYGQEVRIAEVDDLGTIASVTIARTTDTGSTSAGLLVPSVALSSPAPVPISTELITTVHRLFVAALGHPQREAYSVTALTGIASAGTLPL